MFTIVYLAVGVGLFVAPAEKPALVVILPPKPAGGSDTNEVDARA